MQTLNSNKSSSAGFTLVEISIVIGISVFLLIGFMRLFDVYDAKLTNEKATRVVENAQTALSRFVQDEGRYPCPAKRVPSTDADFGKEDCSITGVNGFRDTNNNGSLADDQVLAGIFPTYAISTLDRDRDGNPDNTKIYLNGLVEKNEILQTSLNDPWNSSLSYAVTKTLTAANSFDPYRGNIRVRDEQDRDTGGTDDNAHYVIVSHGKNRLGASDAVTGNATFCDPEYGLEARNCDGGPLFISALKSSETLSAGDKGRYFDDYIVFATRTPTSLWNKMQVGGVVQDSITNVTARNVGIRTATPREKLEVGEWESADETAPDSIKRNSIKADRATFAKEICDPTPGGKCFTPESFLNLGCGVNEYMKRVKIESSGGQQELRGECVPLEIESNSGVEDCPSGYMTGVYTDGSPICGIRPVHSF